MRMLHRRNGAPTGNRYLIFAGQDDGKGAFGRLGDDAMSQEPYRSARRVFRIVDNGSSHRGERSC